MNPSISAGRRVRAPVEWVWEALCDASSWDRWVAGTERYLWMSGPCEAGMTYREITKVGPLRLPSRWHVVDFTPPTKQVHVGRMLGVTSVLTIELTAHDGETDALFSVAVLLPLGRVGAGLLDRFGRRDLEETVRRFAAFSEERAAGS